MFETVAWISIIIGFVTVISISLAAMLITRRREQQAPQTVDYDEAVRRVDAAANAAMHEINKTAELVLKDIDEKYQTLLFLYDLLEDKLKKNSEGVSRNARVSEPGGETPTRGYSSQMPEAALVPQMPARRIRRTDSASGGASAKKTTALSARHEKIVALHDEGMTADDIAKTLNIGKGEVRLIIDLAERTPR